MQVVHSTAPRLNFAGNGKSVSPVAESTQDISADKQSEPSDSKVKTSQVKVVSPEEQQVVDQLKTRDREVRAHEAAHLAAAGGLATGGASYSYQRGPDGESYAIGGEVGIDISPVSGSPSATLAKAETIKRAALAPANPSGQDFMVAQSAGAMAQQARAELNSQQLQKMQHYLKHSDSDPSAKDSTAGVNIMA